jgi:hypothetical protein
MCTTTTITTQKNGHCSKVVIISGKFGIRLVVGLRWWLTQVKIKILKKI